MYTVLGGIKQRTVSGLNGNKKDYFIFHLFQPSCFILTNRSQFQIIFNLHFQVHFLKYNTCVSYFHCFFVVKYVFDVNYVMGFINFSFFKKLFERVYSDIARTYQDVVGFAWQVPSFEMFKSIKTYLDLVSFVLILFVNILLILMSRAKNCKRINICP